MFLSWSLAVLVAVCVSGFLSSVLTALIAIAICLIMKKRIGTKEPVKMTPIQVPPPIYDIVTETSGKESIELTGNVAYAQISS